MHSDGEELSKTEQFIKILSSVNIYKALVIEMLHHWNRGFTSVKSVPSKIFRSAYIYRMPLFFGLPMLIPIELNRKGRGTDLMPKPARINWIASMPC